ncbi:hypothetical protein ACSBR2_024001 [Camellia fascicularis]
MVSSTKEFDKSGHRSIKKRITENYPHSIELVEIHLPSSPDLPPHYHTNNGLSTHLIPTLKTAFDMAIQSFSNILNTLTPNLVIYDFNLPWAPTIASSYGISAVDFIPTGAAMTSSTLHMVTKRDGAEFPFPEIQLRGFHETRDFQFSLDFSDLNPKKFFGSPEFEYDFAEEV